MDSGEAASQIEPLCRVLHDCVEGGASVSFMWPFGMAEARTYWNGIVRALAEDRLTLFGAFRDGTLEGTVQLWLDGPCNQRHRGDIRKLLVHRSSRRLGIARALMLETERHAGTLGLLVLTLDTATGSDGEKLYRSLSWQPVGIIPRYALWPDGRFCDTTIFYKNLDQA